MTQPGRDEELLAAQRQYYDLRAPDYADASRPSDRKSRGLLSSSTVAQVINDLSPDRDVLELACGSGAFTRELKRHARSLTCVDGSPRMIDLNRQIVADPSIDYICADLFTWKPAQQYDVVFFGFWLSHVPPSRFDDFWGLVDSCLAPGGRACFVDEDDRGAVIEEMRGAGEIPTAERRLSDGRAFTIVKVFWSPRELEERLVEGGWPATVRPLADTCLVGTATRP